MLRLLTRGDCEAEFVASLDAAVKCKDVVSRILSSLNIWNLRASLLELKLLYRQAEQNDQNKAVVSLIVQSIPT